MHNWIDLGQVLKTATRVRRRSTAEMHGVEIHLHISLGHPGGPSMLSVFSSSSGKTWSRVTAYTHTSVAVALGHGDQTPQEATSPSSSSAHDKHQGQKNLTDETVHAETYRRWLDNRSRYVVPSRHRTRPLRDNSTPSILSFIDAF